MIKIEFAHDENFTTNLHQFANAMLDFTSPHKKVLAIQYSRFGRNEFIQSILLYYNSIGISPHVRNYANRVLITFSEDIDVTIVVTTMEIILCNPLIIKGVIYDLLFMEKSVADSLQSIVYHLSMIGNHR
jgi:hypothetical protein